MRCIYMLILVFYTSLCKGQNYSSIHFTMENGLPQNSIKDITKDKYGFIWFTTESNVVRYDGRNLDIQDNPNVSSAHLGDFYGSIEEDSIIVFGELHGRKLILKNRKLRRFENNEISRNATNTKGEMFSIFNKTSSEGLYYNNTSKYFIDIKGKKYFFKNGNQIEYEADGNNKVLNIPHTTLRNIFALNDFLFIRNLEQNKLYALHEGESMEIKAPSILLDPTSKIHWQQINGQVFLIRNDELYIGSLIKNELHFKLLIRNDEIKKPIYSLLYDSEFNKIYIGSLTRGLSIYTSHAFRNVPENYVAYASLPYSDSTIITPNGLEIGKNGISKDYQFNTTKENAYLILYDEEDNILYAKSSTIKRFLKNTNYQDYELINFNNCHIKILDKINQYFAIAVTDYNDKNFLYLYDNSQFKIPNFQFQFTKRITSVSPIDNDNFLVGTNSDLYSVSLITKEVKKIQSNISVKHIIKNKDGNHWITTSEQGFYLLKSFNLISIPTDQDKALLRTHYILEDEQGFLWISTNNGLFKTSKKEIDRFLKDSSLPPHYYCYDSENGLLNNELNGGSLPNAYSLKNQDIVIPSYEGYLFFTPQEINSYYVRKNGLFIERMQLNNGEVKYFNNKIKVNSDFEKIEVLIDLPYYANNRSLELNVKQQGENYWKDLKEERKLNIFTLKPGKYKFVFRVFTGKEYDYKTVNLEVIPFFYQTKLFYFILFILAILIILWVIHFRTKHLSGKNKTLKNQLTKEANYQNKLMKIISHDITTPLKFISDLSQKISISNDPETQRQYFNSIHKSSEELFKFTSEMKNYTQLFKEDNVWEDCNIYDLIEERILLFQELAKEKNIIILNDVMSIIRVKTKKDILSVIIHNVLDNALKNSENGKIRITDNTCKFGQITILIIDYGKGMSDRQLNHYNNLAQEDVGESFNLSTLRMGLNLVIHLIKKINAHIIFKKNTPTGTEVSIILKIKPNERNSVN